MALTDNLVSYWELEEVSGTRVDSHGSNDLTDNNTVGYATGIQGNGADFERGNTETLSITDAAQTGLDITGDLTINYWYKPETLIDLITPFSKWTDTGNQRSWLCFHYANGTTRFYASANGSTNVNKLYSTTLTNGSWYMLTYVYDASAGSVQVFQNGSSISTQTGFATGVYNSSAPFIIGAYNGTSQPADGIIDEFAIWDRTLDSSEISNLYNSGSGMSYADISGGAAPTFIPRVSFIM